MNNCHFNAFYLICLRRLHAMDRNIEPETRRALCQAIDKQRYEHERKTGCKCWDQTIAQMDKSVRRIA